MSGSLRADLEKLEGRPYGLYRDLAERSYDVPPGRLCFAHVQGDPFAAPSRLAFDVERAVASLPAAACATADTRRACADFLQRALGRALAGLAKGSGSGRSGVLEIAALGPQVLERS